jgi:hypothetical protein
VTGTLTTPVAGTRAVHPSGDDLPSGHDDYDLNVNVVADPAYDYLVAGLRTTDPGGPTGNYAGNSEETGALHSELEGQAIPKTLWPEDGDRITLLGNWIWDCGHWGVPTEIFSPDYVLPKVGQPCLGSLASVDSIFDPVQCRITGESAEIHPWRAMWDVATRPNSAVGESEAKLYVSTNETRAGLVENCAHQNPPINHVANPAMLNCVRTQPIWQDVSGDYSFFLPAPPQPSPGAHLTTRVVDLGSSGAPAPTLIPQSNGVQVNFHLQTQAPGTAFPNGQQLAMYYQIFAGWDELPPSSAPTHLRISFDKLQVHRAMDPGCTPLGAGGLGPPGCQDESLRLNQGTTPPGEWNLFYDVEGNWGQWGSGEFDPIDGQTLNGSQAVDLYVPPGQGWHLAVLGRECDLQGLAATTGVTQKMVSCPGNNSGGPSELADGNDLPGTILDSWSSAASSLGQHVRNAGTPRTGDHYTSCPDSNLTGCYSLTYTVTEINDAAGVPEGPPLVMFGLALGVVALLAILRIRQLTRAAASAKAR